MDNRDLNLTVGIGLQMERSKCGSRYLVELIGYRVGEGVVVTTPQNMTGTEPPLNIGDEVVVRYMGEVRKYAFRSKVVQISTSPYSHIHLEYPAGIEATMTRRAIRVPVKESVLRLALDDEGEPLFVDMVNISMGGAKLVSPVQLGNEGEEFAIEMPTLSPDRNRVVKLMCIVRHVTMQMEFETTTYQHGVEFIDLEPAAEQFIEHYIRHRADAD